jgi:hypothetical protein
VGRRIDHLVIWGFAPRTFYFYDLDGDVFEARYYAG